MTKLKSNDEHDHQIIKINCSNFPILASTKSEFQYCIKSIGCKNWAPIGYRLYNVQKVKAGTKTVHLVVVLTRGTLCLRGLQSLNLDYDCGIAQKIVIDTSAFSATPYQEYYQFLLGLTSISP